MRAPMLEHESTTPWDKEKALRHVWGAWLQGFAWDHVATLTFGLAPTLNTASRALQSWLRRLARNAQRRVACFHSIERGGSGFLHVHALTVGTSILRIEQLDAAWPSGITRIEVYDASRGAPWYVTKGVLSERTCESYGFIGRPVRRDFTVN
jgi:hypothetical protein